MKKAKLLWIDLEMTGLSPEKDRILEVAAIATGWDLEEVGGVEKLTVVGVEKLNKKFVQPVENSVEKSEFTEVVKVSEKLMKERMTGEFWEKNADVREALMRQNMSGKDAKEVEKELLAFMDKWFGKEIILAGNSIHQDRKFIDREWPRVAERLHYRMLDVSAWKVVFEGKFKRKFVKREAHRALDDIQGSIEELRFYLGMDAQKLRDGARK